MKKQKFLKFFIFALAISVLLSGCSFWGLKNLPQAEKKVGEKISPEIENKLAGQSKIKKFESTEEFATFLEEASLGRDEHGYYGSRRGLMEAGEIAFDSSAKLSAPEFGGGAGTEDYSKTNIQVEGVDEADIIKTDGEYIYAVAKNNLFIVKAYPAENLEIVSKIEFKSRPSEIYISGDKLAIFGANDAIYEEEYYQNYWRRWNEYTFLKIFDISDRKNPKQERSFDFEGYYANSRLIGDWIYLVVDNYNYYYIPGETILPRILENGEVLPEKCSAGSTRCLVPDIYYFDIPYDSYNLTQVVAVNIKNPNSPINSDIYTLSGNQNIYVSLENLYIAYTKYLNEWEVEAETLRELVFPRLSIKDRERVMEIEAVSDRVLSKSEKTNKISRIVSRFISGLSKEEQKQLEKEMEETMKKKYPSIVKEMEKTVIHKIAIDNGKLNYKTFGEVTGNVLNQFSMDEKDGYFRIATTKGRTWSKYIDEEERKSYSNLYVLDGNLKTIGALENLAPGEEIYSARFMQNRAYLVTFEQIDPLFVIDLANPLNPRVLGELKIPGFSNYLHPYDDKFLIGIGKDAVENEWGGVTTKGVKFSLFNVSDVANPKEVDSYIIGGQGSDSLALNDHKAFLFSREKNILSVPATIREETGSSGWGKLVFSGALVFHIDESGFELKGKIDHSDGGKEADEDYFWGYRYYDNNVLRSLYMDDTLYTFSNKYLKANKISDLAEVKKLELKKTKEGGDDDFEIIN